MRAGGAEPRQRPLAFVWDNFGPLHAARVDAVALVVGVPVIGVELHARSETYDWLSEDGSHFRKITLADGLTPRLTLLRRLLGLLVRERPAVVFFCHYDRWEIFISAMVCRAVGIVAFSMNDSKFDDYPRHLWRELAKRMFFLPYHGAITASVRSRDYLRFLGVPRDRIELNYDSVPIARIREMAGAPPAPAGAAFGDRHFTIIARLVAKKNLPMALEAFARARKQGCDRRLVLCGSGPLEAELRQRADDLGVADDVDFRGFVQADAIARTLATSLVVILPSVEEQFGQAIAEALVMGVPVLVSDRCGARDTLVRTAVNGYVFEPDNVVGLARLMTTIARDPVLWTELSVATAPYGEAAGLAPFVASVRTLLGTTRIAKDTVHAAGAA